MHIIQTGLAFSIGQRTSRALPWDPSFYPWTMMHHDKPMEDRAMEPERLSEREREKTVSVACSSCYNALAFSIRQRTSIALAGGPIF